MNNFSSTLTSSTFYYVLIIKQNVNAVTSFSKNEPARTKNTVFNIQLLAAVMQLTPLQKSKAPNDQKQTYPDALSNSCSENIGKFQGKHNT